MKNFFTILGLLAFLSQPVMAQSASPSYSGNPAGSSYSQQGNQVNPAQTGTNQNKKHRFHLHHMKKNTTNGSATGGASNVRGYW